MEILEDEDGGQVAEDDGELDESNLIHSANLNADHMTHHFEKLLSKYNHSIKSFIIAFLADNASVNKAMANKNDVPHLPCHNHLTAIDIGELLWHMKTWS